MLQSLKNLETVRPFAIMKEIIKRIFGFFGLNMSKTNIIKKLILAFSLFALVVIFLNSLADLYQKRQAILTKLGLTAYKGHEEFERYLVNPLKKSSRQIPPDKIEDLKIDKDAHLKGQWSAPIDWNVTAIHSVLLPDYSVMTFGTFGIDHKEHKDIRENKKITITDGRELDRDGGSFQWLAHDVNSGIDFDIWDFKKGYGDDAHQLFKKPVKMDAFCSVVRVLDLDRVFILGGNHNQSTDQPDTQNQTMIYNIKDKKFELSKNLNFKRWYGSIVRTGDNKLVMMGGEDKIPPEKFSIIPEIIDLNNMDEGWKLLRKAESNDLFGEVIFEEWSYPKAFLTSDGNIVGISYDKIWVMDKTDNYRIHKTGEIPLVRGGISRTLEHVNPNSENKKHLKLLTIGSAVGPTSSVVMIGKDKVIVFGGKQKGKEYSPSNKVFLIDFSNSFKPEIRELGNMLYPRSNGNATILPTGEIFINGGHSYNDLEFSNFISEIYNPNNEVSVEMSNSYFRRNYHASSLLLPDGTILTAGGDVWNAEIFYPPYLFTKDWNDKTVLAKRPQILDVDSSFKRGEKKNIHISEENISKVTLISTGSTTHAQGSESKYRSLNFSKLDNNLIQIEIPKNPNEIQNGTYLLFVINSNGVPSYGKIVFVN